MQISSIHIRNFRKLKAVHVEIDEKQTLFVGANNSGKTSFMYALLLFLSKDSTFNTKDFTLNIWKEINKIGDSWMVDEINEADTSIDKWENLLPTVDLWLKVDNKETYRVLDLVPSLDWDGGYVGARIRLEPKLEELIKDYKDAKSKAISLEKSKTGKKNNTKDIYPKDLWEFLDHRKHLTKYFTLKAYKLDQSKFIKDKFQPTPAESIDINIVRNLIKIDFISAQRGFSDNDDNNGVNFGTLSRQLGNYYDSQSDPYEAITEEMLPLLEEIRSLTEQYNNQLTTLLKSPISEIESMNYPGVNNPSIVMNARFDPKTSISHESSVLFKINNNDDSMKLSENYNGLGYRNLISMYFQLMHFREEWINNKEDDVVRPIHLMLIEEPEAHLHAQAQKVFINNAYKTLVKNTDGNGLHTQMIVSTHSGHIALEQDFKNLRYFRRCEDKDNMPIAEVVNLSGIFGSDDKAHKTEKFVSRYIRLTHCDMFFADGIILVEGSGERILMPHFISKEGMNNLYISIIEINGAHAHRFRPLIEKLGIPTLIVTDLDSQETNSDSGQIRKCLPRRGKGYTTNNDTLKKWIPGSGHDTIDNLLSLMDEDKIKDKVRVAYQHEVTIKYNGNDKSVIPYTLEDAVGLANINFFKDEEGVGMVRKFHKAVQKPTIEQCHQLMFDSLNKSKAGFAVDLLYSDNFDNLNTPVYIQEGLKWLKEQLSTKPNVEE